MNTFRVLRCEYNDEQVCWNEVGTLESEYAYYIDADSIGQQFGEGRFMLVSGDRCIEKTIIAEARYYDAPEETEEADDDDDDDDDDESPIADAFTPPDPFSRKV